MNFHVENLILHKSIYFKSLFSFNQTNMLPRTFPELSKKQKCRNDKIDSHSAESIKIQPGKQLDY